MAVQYKDIKTNISENNDYTTFVCREALYPIVKKALTKNHKILSNYIRNYIDRNNQTLFSPLLLPLIWKYDGYHGGQDANALYLTCEVDSKFVAQCMQDSKQLKPSWMTYNKTWYWLMVNIIKYFNEKKDQKNLELIILYLSFAIYSTLHFKYFRGFVPNENIMKYTVNNLNNRFDLKKNGSLIKVLLKISLGNHEKYKSYLEEKNFCDRYIIEYVMNLNTRLNNFIKEIKRQYENNKASGKYLNSDQEDYSEENFYETDNLSYKINQLADKVTTRIVTSGINYEIASNSAKMANVSVSNIKDAIDKIIDKHIEEIREFERLFFQQYLISSKYPIETINSIYFIYYIDRIYNKSNTSDHTIIRIKELLDIWLKANSRKYLETSRAATLANYRKSIYYYFTLSVKAVLTNNY